MSNLRAYGTENILLQYLQMIVGLHYGRILKEGIKGDASLYVSILTENEYFIDDASKYMTSNCRGY